MEQTININKEKTHPVVIDKVRAKYINVKGGKALNGISSPDGAKNSALILLAACPLMNGSMLRIANLPEIIDVYKSINMLREAGFNCQFEHNELRLNGQIENCHFISENAGKIRASLAYIGSMVGTFGEVHLPLPGGDKIGSRPIDIHIDILNHFKVDNYVKSGYLHCKATEFPLKGCDVFLRFPSVLATVNAMLLAVRAKGQSKIMNAAKEPEIVDLANFLNKMGANIVGAGTDTMRVVGVDDLKGINYDVMPDRLETAALVMALVMSRGKGEIINTIPKHLEALLFKLSECGVKIEIKDNDIWIDATGEIVGDFCIETAPYPGFATDLQPISSPFSLLTPGQSIITDTLFPERFAHMDEMQKFGAEVLRTGNTAIIGKQKPLSGAEVIGGDIRTVVSLINVALSIDGDSKIHGVEHLLRGHAQFVDKLKKLRADIDYVY